MEMKGSGGSQSQRHPAVDVDEAALAVTKRARKRSRYLSPPYTDTGVQEKKADGSQEEEGPPPPHVSAAEVLSALRAAALGQGEGMDAAALRFLAMYSRNSNSIFVDDSHAAAGGGGSQDDGGDKPPSAAGVGRERKVLNLNAGLVDGSLAKKKNSSPKNPHPPAAAAAAHPPPVVTTAANSGKKKKKTVGQHCYVENPVALALDFAEGTPLPSREGLFSTFTRFGVVIDSETTISQDKHTARVVFATRAEAEAALSCAATLGGVFGPPFAVASLQDLPPIMLNTPPPPFRKLPLTDIKNNLGKMILALSSKAKATATAAPAPHEANAKTAVDSLSLVGEMQHLLAKVDKVLQLQRASATAHHA